MRKIDYEWMDSVVVSELLNVFVHWTNKQEPPRLFNSFAIALFDFVHFNFTRWRASSISTCAVFLCFYYCCHFFSSLFGKLKVLCIFYYLVPSSYIVSISPCDQYLLLVLFALQSLFRFVFISFFVLHLCCIRPTIQSFLILIPDWKFDHKRGAYTRVFVILARSKKIINFSVRKCFYNFCN